MACCGAVALEAVGRGGGGGEVGHGTVKDLPEVLQRQPPVVVTVEEAEDLPQHLAAWQVRPCSGLRPNIPRRQTTRAPLEFVTEYVTEEALLMSKTLERVGDLRCCCGGEGQAIFRRHVPTGAGLALE